MKKKKQKKQRKMKKKKQKKPNRNKPNRNKHKKSPAVKKVNVFVIQYVVKMRYLIIHLNMMTGMR